MDEAGEDSRLEIRKRAMNLLARREHAPAELAAKLHKRDYAPDGVAAVIDELTADNLLSAVRYAEAAVNAKSARGIGSARIRAELARVQIDESLIEHALNAAEVDWFALAAAVREKRFGRDLPVDFAAKAKQMRFLQQRGFEFDCIRAAVDAD